MHSSGMLCKVALALWNLKVCLLRRPVGRPLPASSGSSCPHPPDSPGPALLGAQLPSRPPWGPQRSLTSQVFLKFSTVTRFSSPFDGFLAFGSWQIRKRSNPGKTCLSLQFARVEMLLSRIYGIRVNYDPSWSRSWVHLRSHAHLANQLCLSSPGFPLV